MKYIAFFGFFLKNITFCLLAIYCAYILILYLDDQWHQRHPYLEYEEPIYKYCHGKSMSDIFKYDQNFGKTRRIEITGRIDHVFVPPNINAYCVLVNPPTITLSIDGLYDPSIRGFVGSFGLDWDCDYREDGYSVIKYSPTNGLQSNGDILFLFK
jgi:hypothetical protein